MKKNGVASLAITACSDAAIVESDGAPTADDATVLDTVTKAGSEADIRAKIDAALARS